MPHKPQVFQFPRLRHFCRMLAALLAAGLIQCGARAQSAATLTLPPDAPAPSPSGISNYDPRNPPEGIFDDEWMEVFINGQKAGYAHELLRRQGDRVFTEDREVYHIGREADVINMTADTTTEETIDGSPRAFHSDTRLAEQPTVVDGHGDGRVFDITVQNGGYTEQRKVTFPEGTVANWGEQRMTLLEGLAEGTTYTMLAYDPSNDAFTPTPTNITVGAREKISFRGLEVETTRLEEKVTAKDGVSNVDDTMWIDANNRVLQSAAPTGLFKIELLAATPQQALADYLPADIFQGSLIPLDRPVPAGATSAVFLLRRTDGQPLAPPPESANEHAETLPDGSVRLTLVHPDAANPGVAQPLPDSAPYLARDAFLDTSDPRLRELAAQAGGAEGAAPAVVAARLRDFVDDYITNKDLAVGFATASETAQRREGDCKEHAVLLAALGRVRGLPSRVVCGLAYMPEYEGREHVLGFHMWTQFYLDGRWVDYDSALNDSRAPEYWRLGMVATDMNDVSLADFTLELIGWMSTMKITLEPAQN